MQRAFPLGVAVMAGILIGRIQIIENHEAKEALVESARADKRALTARRDAIRTHALLDHAERKLVQTWQRLEPMLDDFARAESVIERDAARRRIEQLRWEMDAVEARVVAARELADERSAFRQAFVKRVHAARD